MPRSALTDEGLRVGSVTDMVHLALALADRVRELRAERDAAQEASLDAERGRAARSASFSPTCSSRRRPSGRASPRSFTTASGTTS